MQRQKRNLCQYLIDWSSFFSSLDSEAIRSFYEPLPFRAQLSINTCARGKPAWGSRTVRGAGRRRDDRRDAVVFLLLFGAFLVAAIKLIHLDFAVTLLFRPRDIELSIFRKRGKAFCCVNFTVACIVVHNSSTFLTWLTVSSLFFNLSCCQSSQFQYMFAKCLHCAHKQQRSYKWTLMTAFAPASWHKIDRFDMLVRAAKLKWFNNKLLVYLLFVIS